MEFLRFQGKPPPPHYVPFNKYRQEHQSPIRKRKHWESGDDRNYGSGGGEWSSHNGQNGFAGGGASWQNKKQKLGEGAFQQNQGSFSRPPPQGGHSFGQGRGETGGGYQNQNGYKSGWEGQKKPFVQKKPYGPGPGQFGGSTPQYKPGPRNGGGPSRPAPHAPRSQPYAAPPASGAPRQPSHRPPPFVPSSFGYTAGGPVTGGTQSYQAPYVGAVLQPQVQVVYHAHVAPTQLPYGMSPAPAPGGMPYPFSAQPQPPAVGAPVTAPYHFGGVTAFTGLPGQGQVPGYQAYSMQAQQPGYYSSLPPMPTPVMTPSPAPPSAIPPTYNPAARAPPTVGPPAATPTTAYTPYKSSLGYQPGQPPVPQHLTPPPPTSSSSHPIQRVNSQTQPPRPANSPPNPLHLAYSPPLPPQPVKPPPPPPPPSTAAPPLPPAMQNASPPSSVSHPSSASNKTAKTSSRAMSKQPAPSPAPSGRKTPTGVSRASSGTPAPSSSSRGTKVAIHTVAKTNVAALYGASFRFLPRIFHLRVLRSFHR